MKLSQYFLFFSVLLIAACNLATPTSPGILSKGHSNLEGTENCTKCHLLGKWVSDDKCLDCHSEIKTLVDNKKGYHSSEEVTSEKCAKCHNEHHGINFEIVHFDTLKFDHKLAGYKLEGKHKELSCKKCHKSEFIQPDSLKLKAGTFLGLTEECLTCHDDYHQKTLSKNCIKCHNFEDFKPAKFFNHNKTKYPLKGKHEKVDCIKCHSKESKNGSDFQNFTGIKFQNCTDCHEDKHKAKFGNDCAKCHTVNSFLEISNLNTFNHNLTGYILEGQHKKVSCAKCHKQKFTIAFPHTNCNDCHTDFHKGELQRNGKSPDCKECHTVNNFKTPQYTIDQHNLSNFPLKGSHVATACISCHKKSGTWSFRKIGIKCVDCHKDIHKTFISPKYYPDQNCESCHSSVKWTNISFNHSKTDFDLNGAHKQKTCRDCHYKTTNGNETQIFSNLGKNCVSCHTDIHEKQFDVNGISDCSKCHGNNNWKAEKFDHNNSKFKLDGKHINVACNKCHNTIVKNNKQVVQYKINKLQCIDCHK